MFQEFPRDKVWRKKHCKLSYFTLKFSYFLLWIYQFYLTLLQHQFMKWRNIVIRKLQPRFHAHPLKMVFEFSQWIDIFYFCCFSHVLNHTLLYLTIHSQNYFMVLFVKFSFMFGDQVHPYYYFLIFIEAIVTDV